MKAKTVLPTIGEIDAPVKDVPDSINGYMFTDSIGEGGFAKVFKAIRTSDGTVVAVKVIPKTSLWESGDKQHFQKEIDSMSILNHPGIVKYIDFFADDAKFYYVMEYCKGGDLFDYITKKRILTEQQASCVLKQLLEALAYSHSFKVAHRDLKLENILIDEFPKVKITDFGLCGYIDDGKFMNTFCGSPSYCSPECIEHKEYDGRLSDIWSLGVILYCLVTGTHPWNQVNRAIMVKQILSCDFTLPNFLSFDCKEVISMMLVKNPLERASIKEILDHPWLQKGNGLLMLNKIEPHLETDGAISLLELSARASNSRVHISNGIYEPINKSTGSFEVASLDVERKRTNMPIPLFIPKNNAKLKYLTRTVASFQKKNMTSIFFHKAGDNRGSMFAAEAPK